MGKFSLKPTLFYCLAFVAITVGSAATSSQISAIVSNLRKTTYIESLKVFVKDQQSLWTVVKSQKGNSLILHFLQSVPNGLVSKHQIVFPKSLNAHFTYSDVVSSLKAMDLDSDGQVEILVPYFDMNFIARMGVLKWNPLSQEFERTSHNFSLLGR